MLLGTRVNRFIVRVFRRVRRAVFPRGGLKRGEKAFARGEAFEAVLDWRAAFAAGKTQAALKLGQVYLGSEYIYRDPPEAKHWFQLAAERGDLDGCFELGRMLLRPAEDPSI